MASIPTIFLENQVDKSNFKFLNLLIVGSGVTAASAISLCNYFDLVPDVYTEEKNISLSTSDMKYYLKDNKSVLSKQYDLVIMSPGIFPDNRLVVELLAKNNNVISDIDLAIWIIKKVIKSSQAKTVCLITGTNGKTTTTKMVTTILQTAKVEAIACGNLGYPILQAVIENPLATHFVVEVSSFQLFWSQFNQYDYGVLLNTAADHLDFHQNQANYLAAKAKVLTAKQALINLESSRMISDIAGRDSIDISPNLYGFAMHKEISNLEKYFYLSESDLYFSDKGQNQYCSTLDFLALVPKNYGLQEDALAAILAAKLMGVDYPLANETLKHFQVDGHRFHIFRVDKGVKYIDDSKATNPHATQLAFKNLEKTIWVAGGNLKGLALEALIPQIKSKIVKAIIFGVDLKQYLISLQANNLAAMTYAIVFPEQFTEIKDLLPEQNIFVVEEKNIANKLKKGESVMSIVSKLVENVVANEEVHNVLLSPAAASLDLFSSYAERGDIFIRYINARLDQKNDGNIKKILK